MSKFLFDGQITLCVYYISSCSIQLLIKKKNLHYFANFTDKRTFVSHTSNIVTNYLLEDIEEKEALTIEIATAAVIATVIVLTSLVAITVGLILRKRSQETTQHDDDLCYAKLYRERNLQNESQTLHPANDLYNQLHLSPSTGQAEFISKTETDNKNNCSHHHDQHSFNPSVDTGQPKSVTSPIESISADKDISTLEQPTYAVVDKKKKHMKGKEPVNYLSENSSTTNESLTTHNTEGVEELYTAVNKKTQPTTANNEVESPPIPPHTVEQLYTAVMKKPKARETDDEVKAPPVPPHTVEELYTAVQKNKN